MVVDSRAVGVPAAWRGHSAQGCWRGALGLKLLCSQGEDNDDQQQGCNYSGPGPSQTISLVPAERGILSWDHGLLGYTLFYQ